DTGLESVVEYGHEGRWSDGISILELMVQTQSRRVSPLVYYYLGEFHERLGNPTKAAEARRLASEASPDYGFPFQWEAIPALRHAIQENPQDSRAPYYLGNLLFDWQPDEALKLWQESANLDPSFAIVHRNIALAFGRESSSDSRSRAIGELEKAVTC